MNKEIVLVVVAILVFSASTFLINHYFLPAQLINIPQTYLFFTLASIITMLILVVVKRKNLDIVGVSFLLITTIKAGIAFWYGKNIIYASEKYNTDRFNFYIVFVLFLLIETLLTIYLLNKTPNNPNNYINLSKKI